MQFNTFVRLGGLAFNVAQDDKVRELFTMVHKGAKRRGIYGQPLSSGASQSLQPSVMQPTTPIPFAPQPSPPAQHPHVPQGMPYGGSGMGKYLTADNAKKVIGMAGTVKNLLVK